MRVFESERAKATVYLQVYQTLSYGGVIAGGAAADLSRARDIDVFYGSRSAWEAACVILNVPTEQWEAEAIVEGDPDYTEDFRVGTAPVLIEDFRVQLIWTPDVFFNQPTGRGGREILKLLDTFDISTHMVAVPYSLALERREIRRMYGHAFTPLTAPPRIINPKAYPQTLNRYLKICARYGFTPTQEELMKVQVPQECYPRLMRQGRWVEGGV